MKIAVCDDENMELSNIEEYLAEYLESRDLQAKTAFYNNPSEMITSELTQGGSDIYILYIIMP